MVSRTSSTNRPSCIYETSTFPAGASTANRPGSRGVAALTYADRPAMEAAADAEEALGAEFAEALGLQVTEVAEYDLVVAHLRVPELV